MSDQADLEKIKPLEKAPSDQPDPKTAAEVAKLRTDRATPTDRMTQAHLGHIHALRERIEYHCGEHEKLRLEVISVRTELDGTKQTTGALTSRCTQLETSSGASGCVTLLGTVFTLAGGGMLSFAGAAPGIPEDIKATLCYTGLAVMVCSVLVLASGFTINIWYGWWKKPRGPRQSQSEK